VIISFLESNSTLNGYRVGDLVSTIMHTMNMSQSAGLKYPGYADAVDNVLAGHAAAIYATPARARAVNRIEDVVTAKSLSRDASRHDSPAQAASLETNGETSGDADDPPHVVYAEAPSLALFQEYTVSLVVDMSRATFTAVANRSGSIVILAERLSFVIRRLIRSLAYAPHGLARVRRDLGRWRPGIKVQIIAANCPHVKREKPGSRHVTFASPAPNAPGASGRGGISSGSPNAAMGGAARAAGSGGTSGSGAAAGIGGGGAAALSSSAARLDVIMPPTPVDDLDSSEGLQHCDMLLEETLREYRRRGLCAAEDLDWCDSLDVASVLERVISVVPASAAGERAQSIVLIGDLSEAVHESVAERILLLAPKVHRKSILFHMVDLGYHNDADLRKRCLHSPIPRPPGPLATFVTMYLRGHIYRLPESQEEQSASSHYCRIIGLDYYTSQDTPDPQPDARLGLAFTVKQLPPLQVLSCPAGVTLPSPLPHIHPPSSRRLMLWESLVQVTTPDELSVSTALILVAHSRSAHGWSVGTVFCRRKMVRFDAKFTAALGWGDATLLFLVDTVKSEDGRESVRLRSMVSGSDRVLGLIQGVLDASNRNRALTNTEVVLADLCFLAKELHETEVNHLRICVDPRASLAILTRSSSFNGCATDVYSTFFVKFFTILVRKRPDPAAATMQPQQPRTSAGSTYDFLAEAAATLQRAGWSNLVDLTSQSASASTAPSTAMASGEAAALSVGAVSGGSGSVSVAASPSASGSGMMVTAAWSMRCATVVDTFLDSKPLLILQAWQPRALEGFECYPVHMRLLMPHVHLDAELLTQLHHLLTAFRPDPERFPLVSLEADETDLTGATLHRLISRHDASAILTKRERRMEHRAVESPFATGGLLASAQTEAVWSFEVGNFAVWSSYCNSFARLLIDWRLNHDVSNPFKLLYLHRTDGPNGLLGGYFALVWRPAARAFDGESDEAVAEYHAIDCSASDLIHVAHVATRQSFVPSTTTPEPHDANRGTMGHFPAVDNAQVPAAERQAAELQRIVEQDARIIRVGRALGILLTKPKTLPQSAAPQHAIPHATRGGPVEIPVSVSTLLPQTPGSYKSLRLSLDLLPSSVIGTQAVFYRERLRAWIERFFNSVLEAHWYVPLDIIPTPASKELVGQASRGPATPMDDRPSQCFPSQSVLAVAPPLGGTLPVRTAPSDGGKQNEVLMAVSTRAGGPLSFWFVRRGGSGTLTTAVSSTRGTPLIDVIPSGVDDGVERSGVWKPPSSTATLPNSIVSVPLQYVVVSHDELRNLCFSADDARSQALQRITRCSTREDPELGARRVANALQRLTSLAASAFLAQAVQERPEDKSFHDAALPARDVLTHFQGTADVSHCLQALRAYAERIGADAAAAFQGQLLNACKLRADAVTPLSTSSTSLFVLNPVQETNVAAASVLSSPSPVHSPVTQRPLDDARPLEAPPVFVNFSLNTDDAPGHRSVLPQQRHDIAKHVMRSLVKSPKQLMFAVDAWTFPVALLRWANGGTATIDDFDLPVSTSDGETPPLPFSLLPEYVGTRLESIVATITDVANKCVVDSTILLSELADDFNSKDTRLLAAMMPSIQSSAYLVAEDQVRFSSVSTTEDRVVFCLKLIPNALEALERRRVSLGRADFVIHGVEVEPSRTAAFGVLPRDTVEGSSRTVAALVIVMLDYNDTDDDRDLRPATVTVHAAGPDAVIVSQASDTVREWIRMAWLSRGREQLMKSLFATNHAADDLVPMDWGFTHNEPPRGRDRAPFLPPGVLIRCVRVAPSVAAVEVVNALHQRMDLMRLPNRNGCFVCEDAFFRIAVARHGVDSDPEQYLMSQASIQGHGRTDSEDAFQVTLTPPSGPSSEASGSPSGAGRSASPNRKRAEYIDIHLYGTIGNHAHELKALVVEAHNDTVMKTMAVFQEVKQVAHAPNSTPERIFARCPASMTFNDAEMRILRTAVLGEATILPAGLTAKEDAEAVLEMFQANVRHPELYLCPIVTVAIDNDEDVAFERPGVKEEASAASNRDESGRDLSASTSHIRLTPLGVSPRPLDIDLSGHPVEAPSNRTKGPRRDFVLLMVDGGVFISSIYSVTVLLTDEGDWAVHWYSSKAEGTAEARQGARGRFMTARDTVERAMRCACCELQLTQWSKAAPAQSASGTPAAAAADTTPSPMVSPSIGGSSAPTAASTASLVRLPEDRKVEKALSAVDLSPVTDTPLRASAHLYKAEKTLSHKMNLPAVIARVAETGFDAMSSHGLHPTAYSCEADPSKPFTCRRLIGGIAWQEHQAMQDNPNPHIVVLGYTEPQAATASNGDGHGTSNTAAPAAVLQVRRDRVVTFVFHSKQRDAIVGALKLAVDQLTVESFTLARSVLRTLGYQRRGVPKGVRLVHTPAAARGGVFVPAATSTKALPFVPSQRKFRMMPSPTCEFGVKVTAVIANRKGMNPSANFPAATAVDFLDREGDSHMKGYAQLRAAIHHGTIRGHLIENKTLACNTQLLPWATSMFTGSDYVRHTARVAAAEKLLISRALREGKSAALLHAWKIRRGLNAVAFAGAVADTQQVSVAFHTARVPDTELDTRQTFDATTMGQAPVTSDSVDSRVERPLHHINQALNEYTKFFMLRFPNAFEVVLNPTTIRSMATPAGSTATHASPAPQASSQQPTVNDALDLRLRWRYGVLTVDNETLRFQPNLRYFVVPVYAPAPDPTVAPTPSLLVPPTPSKKVHTPKRVSSAINLRALAEAAEALNVAGSPEPEAANIAGFIIVELGFTQLHYAVDIHTICYQKRHSALLVLEAENVKEGLCFSSVLYDMMIHRFVSTIMRCTQGGRSWEREAEDTRLQAAVDRHLALHPDPPFRVASALRHSLIQSAQPQTFPLAKRLEVSVQGWTFFASGFVAPSSVRGNNQMSFYSMACATNLHAFPRDNRIDLSDLLQEVHQQLQWLFEKRARIKDGENLWHLAFNSSIEFDNTRRLMRLARQYEMAELSRELSALGLDWAAACSGPSGPLYKFSRQFRRDWRLVAAPSGTQFVMLYTPSSTNPLQLSSPEDDHSLSRGAPSVGISSYDAASTSAAGGGGAMSGRCIGLAVLDGTEVFVSLLWRNFQETRGQPTVASADEAEAEIDLVEDIAGLLSQVAFASVQ
jgi:hypothetical protein